MKKILSILPLFLLLFSCSDEESLKDVVPVITFTPDTRMEQVVYADETDSVHGIGFNANTMWRVDIRDAVTRGVENTTDWIRVDQYGGGRGDFNLTVTTTVNETGKDRKAEIIITCGDKTIFTVEQKGVKRGQ